MEQDKPRKSGVSRLRRAIFTYVTVAACITLSYLLAMKGADTKVAQVVADGLITLAMWLALAYVGASAIDYSLGERLSPLSRLRGVDDSRLRGAPDPVRPDDNDNERRRGSRRDRKRDDDDDRTDDDGDPGDHRSNLTPPKE